MNKSIPLLAVVIGCLLAGAVAGPAMARTGGSFGDGGGAWGTMSSGTMSSFDTRAPSDQWSAPMAPSSLRDPDTRLNSANVFRALDSPIPRIANSPGP
jgi:hypothetical protein